jgi:hypothetical protein
MWGRLKPNVEHLSASCLPVLHTPHLQNEFVFAVDVLRAIKARNQKHYIPAHGACLCATQATSPICAARSERGPSCGHSCQHLPSKILLVMLCTLGDSFDDCSSTKITPRKIITKYSWWHTSSPRAHQSSRALMCSRLSMRHGASGLGMCKPNSFQIICAELHQWNIDERCPSMCVYPVHKSLPCCMRMTVWVLSTKANLLLP